MIEETHRCAHIVPTVIRQTIVDTDLLGHRIPKNTHVFFYTSSSSFMKPAFDIPDEKRSKTALDSKDRFGVWKSDDVADFVPERWLKRGQDSQTGIETEVFDPQSGPQMAFGAGPRGCFGRRLAYVEMRIMIVLLIWKFEFLELSEKLNSFEGVDIFAVPPKDCYIRLRKVST